MWVKAILLMLLAIPCNGCLSLVYALGSHSDNAEWIRTQQAKIEIFGEVRDEHGQALRKVRVRANRDYLVAGFSEIPDERQDVTAHTVNGSFHFCWNPAETVHLKFEKSGYESADLVLQVKNTVAKGNYGQSKPPASPVSQTNCVVILRERNQPRT